MTEFPKMLLNTVRRKPDRGVYDQETIYSIIDEALISYVGFVEEGQPVVLPSIHARIGDVLYYHGAKTNRMLRIVQSGAPVCITTALVDGIVFARSIFDHSLNYRSVTVFGLGRPVEDPVEKNLAIQAIVDHIARGRWEDARQPSSKEIQATIVAAVSIESASAKIREGESKDAEADYSLAVWAGVLPLVHQPQTPKPDARLTEDIPIPDYIAHYHRK